MTLEKHMLFQLLVQDQQGLARKAHAVLTEGNAHKMDKFDPRILMLEATDMGTPFHTGGET